MAFLSLLLLGLFSIGRIQAGPAPPAPPADCKPPTADDCAKGDIARNPIMYLPDPCSNGFYQCGQDQFGGYTLYKMACPDCQKWDQAKLTCVYDGSDCPEKEAIKETVTKGAGSCTVSNGDYVNKLEEVPERPQSYYVYVSDKKVLMPCPSGTHFSSDACRCVLGGAVTDMDPFVCLTFDGDEPFKTEGGIYIDPKDVSIEEGGISGNKAVFNGKTSNIEIPAFNNKETPKMSISMWFKRDNADNSSDEVLFTNAGCKSGIDPSISLMSGNNNKLLGGYRTSYGSNQISAFKNIQATDNWNHVAMVYDGQTISFYLNGASKSTAQAGGMVAGVHCPLMVGAQYGNQDNFKGAIDQLCFYNYALKSGQVEQLYNKPGDVMHPKNA